MDVRSERLALEAQRYAVLADHGEAAQEVGEAEELLDTGADLVKVDATAGGFAGDDEADQGAEAHAVHIGDVAEVEHDALVLGHELAHAGVEVAADFRDQTTMEVDEGGSVFMFDFKGEDAVRLRLGHGEFPFCGGALGNWEAVRADSLIERGAVELKSWISG